MISNKKKKHSPVALVARPAAAEAAGEAPPLDVITAATEEDGGDAVTEKKHCLINLLLQSCHSD